MSLLLVSKKDKIRINMIYLQGYKGVFTVTKVSKHKGCGLVCVFSCSSPLAD